MLTLVSCVWAIKMMAYLLLIAHILVYLFMYGSLYMWYVYKKFLFDFKYL